MEPYAGRLRWILPTVQCGRDSEGEEMDRGQEQNAEAGVQSQETKNPEGDVVQTKTETDVSILTLFPMDLSFNDLLPQDI